MDDVNQKTALETMNNQLEQEIGKRKQAEERVRILTEELAALKNQMAFNKADTEERIRFDMLLSEISAQFINLHSDKVDVGIEDAQRRICECLGLDVCALWQWTGDDPDRLIMTHLYRSMEGPPVPEKMDANEFFPWCQQELRSGRIISVSCMDNLPPEAAQDVEAWRQFDVKTSLTIPLSSGNGPPFGGISFNDMKSERTWSETLVKRLQLVAEIFANSLSRKRYEESLRESELRLSMSTDAAGAGLWGIGADTKKFWVSAKFRELFYYAPDEELNYESFIEKIHPEDRKQVDQAVQQALQSGDIFHIDYRILLPDGHIRWICSRGHSYLKPDGETGQMMGVSLDITDRMVLEGQLMDRIQEIEKLKQRLEEENLYLHEEIKFLAAHETIVSQSLAMKRILAEAAQVAITDSTVLILGETGTGKEMLARAIHQMSKLKDRVMVTFNCASIPSTLIESELFGRETGAYTGAMTRMIGRFEIADGGTLFLDEIGELPIEVQGKLLRVLEEGVFERLGSTRPIRVKARIIAATNRDIENEVAKGRFRKDLFYRLNVFPIVIPPLRQRPEDIPLLAWAFVKEFQKRMGKKIETVSKKIMESLQSYYWPGNVRELRNVIERAMILSSNSTLVVQVPKFELKGKDDSQNLEDFEQKHIESVLERTGWRVAAAAKILGLKRSTLYSKMKRLGIIHPKL